MPYAYRGEKVMLSGVGWVVTLVLVMGFSGCALRGSHYRAVLDLRQESSLNYSKEILDAIVGVRERAELPTFFYVEAGHSSWSPSVSGSFGATAHLVEGNLKQLTGGDSLNLSPSGAINESLSNSIQFNDFGSAAMSRVTAIYAFLCYPIQIGGGILPNGALYTVIREADRPDDFILCTKREKDGYLGVTEETRFEFFEFSRDIIYWSRHFQPDPNDLESAAGNLYAFFAQYPAAEQALSDAIESATKAHSDYDGALSSYIETFKQVQKLEEEFQKSKDDPKVLTTILTETYQQRMIQYQQLGGANSEKNAKDKNLTAQEQRIEGLLQNLQQTVLLIKSMDPEGDSIDVDAICEPFRKRVEALMARDERAIREVQYQMPSAAGLNAQENTDKLYRDRFESLPGRFEGAFQAHD